MRKSKVIPKLIDAWDGSPLRPFWKQNDSVRPDEKVFLRKPRRRQSTERHDLFPNYTEDCWTGRWFGYGRDEGGRPLFRTMINAVKFATAAYKAGYRVEKGKR